MRSDHSRHDPFGCSVRLKFRYDIPYCKGDPSERRGHFLYIIRRANEAPQFLKIESASIHELAPLGVYAGTSAIVVRFMQRRVRLLAATVLGDGNFGRIASATRLQFADHHPGDYENRTEQGQRRQAIAGEPSHQAAPYRFAGVDQGRAGRRDGILRPVHRELDRRAGGTEPDRGRDPDA